MNTRQQNAWMYHGGGLRARATTSCATTTSSTCPAGNTGAQMGGWFRKEIKTRRRPEGPQVPHRRLRRPGPRPSSAWCRSRSPAATSIRRSRSGTIDAAEWVGPYRLRSARSHQLGRRFARTAGGIGRRQRPGGASGDRRRAGLAGRRTPPPTSRSRPGSARVDTASRPRQMRLPIMVRLPRIAAFRKSDVQQLQPLLRAQAIASS